MVTTNHVEILHHHNSQHGIEPYLKCLFVVRAAVTKKIAAVTIIDNNLQLILLKTFTNHETVFLIVAFYLIKNCNSSMVNKTLPYVFLDNRTLPELNSRGISSSTTTKNAKKQKNKKYKSSSIGHVSKQKVYVAYLKFRAY